MDKYILYDKIVGTMIINIKNNYVSEDGFVIIKNYNKNNIEHKLFFKLAELNTELFEEKIKGIKIETSIKDFLLIKIKNKTNKINIKRLTRKKRILEEEKKDILSVDFIMNFVANSFKVEKDIYEKIYNEYYR